MSAEHTLAKNGVRRGTIVLVRHGHSAHVHDRRWMSSAGVPVFERAYNDAGIRDDSEPPPALREIAARVEVIAASDMLRAIASARRLAPAREPEVSPLLREIELETPRWIPTKLRFPITAWDVVSYARWSLRLLVNADHEHMRRADAATDWLLERLRGHSSLLAVTHGGFRRILDARLRARGWRRAPGALSYENWSSWVYTN
jgi:broad specificity phosphatase PhoE